MCEKYKLTELQLELVKKQWKQQRRNKAVHNGVVFRLLRCSGTDEQYQEQQEQRQPMIGLSQIMNSNADKVRIKKGFALMEFNGARDKRCNGIAAVRRNKLKVIKGGKLTEREERLIDDIVRQAILEVQMGIKRKGGTFGEW